MDSLWENNLLMQLPRFARATNPSPAYIAYFTP